MIQSVTVINHLGESLKLDLAEPEKSGFIVKNITGLGPVKANINTSDICTADGSQFNSARKEKRNIVITLDFQLFPSVEDARQLTYRYFPLKKNVTLIIETDNRTSCCSGYIESNEPEIFSQTEITQISIICPDPNLYSVIKTQKTRFSGLEPMFEFPFDNDSLTEPKIEFGYEDDGEPHLINYEGDTETGFTLTIHFLGYAKNVSLYNIHTREYIKINTDAIALITGSEVAKGDDIIIRTEHGRKSITLMRDGKYYNALSCLVRGSSWIQLKTGPNVFAFTVEEGKKNVQFIMENYIVYEGV